MLQNKKKEMCFLNSGCSRHMTKDKRKFLALKREKIEGLWHLETTGKTSSKELVKLLNQKRKCLLCKRVKT